MNKELPYKKMISNIRKELETYITENNIKSLVIGISGGIDSAVCAALAKPVCNKLKIPLIGRSIPITTNTSAERDRADLIGNAFCTNYDEVYYAESPFKELRAMVEKEDLDVEEEDKNSKIRMGNVKARLRMIYLYDLAQLHNGMVLSTDNYTEFMLGFWTLHGDVGDYGMLQNLWKTEVYKMADCLVDHFNIPEPRKALESCIDCQATDGLGISKTDLDQIMPSWEGSSREGYAEVDKILKKLFEPNFDPRYSIDRDHPVIKRHFATQYKRNNPFNIKRSLILPAEEKVYEKKEIEVNVHQHNGDKPYTQGYINALNLQEDDVVSISYEYGEIRSDSETPSGWYIEVTRTRLENNEEFTKRVEDEKFTRKSLKERRYENYLKLKKEFEL